MKLPCLNRHWEGKVAEAIRAEQDKAGQAEKQWQSRLGEVSSEWQAKLAQGQVQWEKDRAAAEQAWREAKSQAEQQWKQQLESIQHAHRSVPSGLLTQLLCGTKVEYTIFCISLLFVLSKLLSCLATSELQSQNKLLFSNCRGTHQTMAILMNMEGGGAGRRYVLGRQQQPGGGQGWRPSWGPSQIASSTWLARKPSGKNAKVPFLSLHCSQSISVVYSLGWGARCDSPAILA